MERETLRTGARNLGRAAVDLRGRKTQMRAAAVERQTVIRTFRLPVRMIDVHRHRFSRLSDETNKEKMLSLRRSSYTHPATLAHTRRVLGQPKVIPSADGILPSHQTIKRTHINAGNNFKCTMSAIYPSRFEHLVNDRRIKSHRGDLVAKIPPFFFF